MKKFLVLWSFVMLLLAIALTWFVFHGLFRGYCSDACIRADLATIAPRIHGVWYKNSRGGNDVYLKRFVISSVNFRAWFFAQL